VILRAACGAVGYGAMVYAVSNLPLMVSTIIMNTNPFWCALLGVFILGEKVSKFHILCMFGGFLGVVIVSMNKAEDATTKSDLTGFERIQNHFVGVSAALISAFFAAIVFVTTRALKQIHFSLILFHYGWMAVLMFWAWALTDYWLNSTETWPSIFRMNLI
jgi:drug/metabolite transporter (DMT)-like permease